MNSNINKLAIITVTFNADKHLPALIASLRAQVNKNFEWIVADGNSADGTVELLKNCNDLNISWVSEHDFGIYDAMNKAIKRSTADYYLVMGADDVLQKDAVKNILNALSDDKNTDVLVGQALVNERLFPRYRSNLSWLYGMSSFVHTHSVGTVFKKDLHTRFGYYSNHFPLAADAYFIKKIFQSQDIKIKYYDIVHGTYGTQGISSTATLRVMMEYFHIQFITEKYPILQILIFTLRYLKFKLFR
jgi:glycosyltransferase involved in cell wall biosynthesis